jgi:hypothetical protein
MPDKRGFISSLLSKNINRGGVWLIILVAILSPLFILSFYNHPCNDDYALADIVRQKGFFEAQKYLYFNWSGRYFAFMLQGLGPLEFNVYWGYKWNTPLLLIIFLMSTYWLSGRLFKELDRTGKMVITSIFFFAFIMRMPDSPQGIFWRSGTFAGLIACFLALLLMACIISYYQSEKKRLYLTLSCLLAVAIIGSYELHLVYIDLVVSIIALVSILKKRALFFPITLLAVCIIFSIISIKAPGNSARGSTYQNAHQLLFSLKESLRWGKDLLMHWVPFMLFTGLLLFDFLSKYTYGNKQTDTIFVVSPVITFTACLAIPVIGLFICFWAEGEYPPLRALNVSYFYFIAGMMYFSFSLIGRIKKRYPDFKFPGYIKLPLYAVLVYLLVFRTNNIRVAYKEIISGTASAYDKEEVKRHEFLTSYKGDSCMIDSIRDIPTSLVFVELPRDKNSWINTSFREYYHKKYIGIKGRE